MVNTASILSCDWCRQQLGSSPAPGSSAPPSTIVVSLFVLEDQGVIVHDSSAVKVGSGDSLNCLLSLVISE